MSDAPPPLERRPTPPASSGETVDDGKGRIFPCEQCGADLTFNIGQQSLKCPYCGYVKTIEVSEDAEIQEQDFHATLERLRELKEKNREKDHPAETGQAPQQEVRCGACGGVVVFVGSLTSSECPYCASPIQREKVHDSPDRIPVDGLLPFQVEKDQARENLTAWVKSRWFAPGEFLRRGVQGKFNGVYLPYWTYDSLTFTRYHGERGEHYYVTVGTGENQRQERRTRWYPASGSFQRFFDDVLVLAATGMNRGLMHRLEPWPLNRLRPFQQELLAGYLARTYELGLVEGFHEAKQRIDEAIQLDVYSRIGGDEQRVHSINTQHSAITFKHLLLPVWLLAYRYQDKSYQVMINAVTGEVQGERPYSWIKIALATILAVAAAGAMVYFLNRA